MWRPRPASWPWLAAHELRLLWRMQSRTTVVLLGLLVTIFLLLLHVLAWIGMRRFDLEGGLAKRPAVRRECWNGPGGRIAWACR